MKGRAIFIVGAATFAALQVLWSLGAHTPRNAWVMKTGTGIGLSFGAFVVMGAFVVAYRYAPKELMKRASRLWLGAMASLVIALALVGPGNLWPLVMVLDGVIIFAGIMVGAAIGAALGPRVRRPSEGSAAR